ncbi:TATA element modulatory factor 1 TATA binding-domain-containing protein (Fragment), variant 2 [Balamuthia mandrillaris]
MKNWGGFKWIETATQTIKNVEKSIDKAIGIPDEEEDRKSQGQAVEPVVESSRHAATENGGALPPPLAKGSPTVERRQTGGEGGAPLTPHSNSAPATPMRNSKQQQQKKKTEDALPLEELLNGDLLPSYTPPKRPPAAAGSGSSQRSKPSNKAATAATPQPTSTTTPETLPAPAPASSVLAEDNNPIPVVASPTSSPSPLHPHEAGSTDESSSKQEEEGKETEAPASGFFIEQGAERHEEQPEPTPEYSNESQQPPTSSQHDESGRQQNEDKQQEDEDKEEQQQEERLKQEEREADDVVPELTSTIDSTELPLTQPLEQAITPILEQPSPELSSGDAMQPTQSVIDGTTLPSSENAFENIDQTQIPTTAMEETEPLTSLPTDKTDEGNAITNSNERKSEAVTETQNEPSVSAVVEDGRKAEENDRRAVASPEGSTDLRVMELTSKIQMVTIILKERERQLEAAAMANAALQESNQTLKRKLEEADANKTRGEEGQEALKREFSIRLGTLERNLAAVVKERDALKKVADSSSSAKQSELQEKEQIITELREEGEKLAKKQLTLESVVKKLRSQIKEEEALSANLKQRLQNTEALLETKIQRIKELEASYVDTKGTISSFLLLSFLSPFFLSGIFLPPCLCTLENMDKMKDLYETTARQLEEKTRNFEATKQKTTELEEQVAELKKAAEQQREAATAVSWEAQQQAKDELNKAKAEFEQTLKQQKEEATEQQSALMQTIQQLQASLSRHSDEQSWREDELRKEIHSLQERLQSAEARNEELAASVPETTRPLLRQIEALRASNAARSLAWDDIERNLTARIKEEEERAHLAEQSERKALAALEEARSRVKWLESALSTESNTSVRLSTEVQSLRTAVEEAKKEKQEVQAQLLSLQQQHQQLRKERKQVERELRLQMKEEVEVERGKYARLEQMLKEKEERRMKKDLNNLLSSSSPSNTGSVSAPSSPITTSLSPSLPLSSSNGNIGNSGGAVGSWSPNSFKLLSSNLPPSAMIEKLQSALHLREGEIANLQAQLQSYAKSKLALEDELVALTAANDALYPFDFYLFSLSLSLSFPILFHCFL